MLFSGLDPKSYSRLWVTDGTAAGTHEVTQDGSDPSSLTVFNGKVLFCGDDTVDPGIETLWVTDGTAAGTQEVAGAGKAVALGLYYPLDLTVNDGKVLFSATDENDQRGLWVTDGTAAGTHELPGSPGADDGN